MPIFVPPFIILYNNKYCLAHQRVFAERGARRLTLVILKGVSRGCGVFNQYFIRLLLVHSLLALARGIAGCLGGRPWCGVIFEVD